MNQFWYIDEMEYSAAIVNSVVALGFLFLQKT